MNKVITLGTIGDNLRKQIKEGDIHLLSELNLEPEEIEIIRSNAYRLVQHALSGRNTFDIQIAYLMMDVGMRFYSEGTYWADFWNQVEKEPSSDDQRILGTFFIETIRRYGLATTEIQSGRKYVNMILMHAFIPERYGIDFFNLVQKYFTYVLKGTLPENLDSELGVFGEIFGEEKVTNSYPELKYVQLLVPTKLALKKKENYVSILSKILRRISNDYETIDEVRLGIYEEPFKKWAAGGNRKRSSLDIVPTISYDLERGKLYVRIPPQVLDLRNGMRCTIESSGGSVLTEFNMTSYSQFNNQISDEKVLRLDWDPLDEFVIKIGESTLYKNTNDGFIFLDKNGQKKSKVSLGFNMVIVPVGMEIDVQTSEITNGNGYVIKGFLMKRGDKVCISGQTYVIEEEILDSIYVVSDSLDLDCTDQDGNEYKIFSRHPTIRVSPNNKASKLRLSFGRKLNRFSYDALSDLESDKDVRHDRSANYLIDISKKHLISENGIYTIRSRGRDVFKYIYLEDFRYDFEKKIYETDEDSRLFFTGNPDGQQFNTAQGAVVLPSMEIDGRNVTISVQIPSRRFSFDGKKWMLFDSKELYYRDVEQKQFFIYCPTLVFPWIEAIYTDSRRLPLEIQGPYLTCKFEKIVQIGYLLEAAKEYMPQLKFKCGRFDLFTIRYTADYNYVPGRIVRKNAPPNTYSICEMGNGDAIRFSNDYADISSDVTGKIEVYEYYDDGFGEQKRFAFSVKAGIKLRGNKEAIIRGETPDSITVEIGKDCNRYDWDQIDYLISIDGMMNPEDRQYALDYCSDMDYKHSIELYEQVCEMIKDIILTDSSVWRLKQRINRFKDTDVEFTKKLCKRCLELADDSAVRYQLAYLEMKNKQ